MLYADPLRSTRGISRKVTRWASERLGLRGLKEQAEVDTTQVPSQETLPTWKRQKELQSVNIQFRVEK